VNLDSAAVIVTAFKRPGYLRKTLASWQAARGLDRVRSFTVALGFHEDAFTGQCRVIEDFRHATELGEKVQVKVDSEKARKANGMHRAIGEAATHVLADPGVQFVIFGEEDITVSSDVLEYMSWARAEFAGRGAVVAVCAHSRSGAGWDPRQPAGDTDADQAAVRLAQYFNPWVWGTWRNRWERLLEPTWDWECNSGGPLDSGYDHNIHRRILPEGGLSCVVPDASRSQNIGRHGGWASNEETWGFSQAQSFRADRDPVPYKLVTG
jgi:hypothetical protein